MVQSKTVETVVGVFVAAGLAALVVLAMRVGNLTLTGMSESETYTIEAHFENIGGLKVRSPVKMAGVVVGRVAGIGFDTTTYEAVATLKIDAGFSEIPEDTSASIYTAGLLGEQYVGLEPGGSDMFLQDGDKITLTEPAVVLERVIGQFLYRQGQGGD